MVPPPQGEGGSPSYCMMASNTNEGEWKFYILQEFINRGWIKKNKRGKKKRLHLLSPRKGEIGGLTFFSTFFQSWKKQAISKCSPLGTKLTYDVLAKT